MSNRTPFSIVAAGVIIAVALAVLFRWHIITSEAHIVRIDRWTGKVQICTQPDGKIVCVDE
jgi:hypothetical protein